MTDWTADEDRRMAEYRGEGPDDRPARFYWCQHGEHSKCRGYLCGGLPKDTILCGCTCHFELGGRIGP